ncbi:hypothetical protein [Marinobacter sp. CHS3-4]|uniref:hypothetical protein n=1 Tax=Marinobacter sp. CHS3-4 TaxID=3045174 RepID=UPI0024B5A4EF|nr:hypothetical protein [Marinobacter sp. CHS3-4]MDI9243855.1 hypothetical protein [Marinobacter sp. CHS3-4]
MICLILKGIFGDAALGLILKFAILFFCIKHLLDHGRPITTAFIYAGSFLILGFLGGLFFGWAEYGLLLLPFNFLIDAVVGLVFFSLLDRYRDRLFLFYALIVAGIAMNFGFHLWISNFTLPDFGSEQKVAASRAHSAQSSAPPHLWSHHKVLNVSAEICAQRGVASLHALNFSSVVRNGTYVYGNSGTNRAAVKCVEHDQESSFLYIAVAGPVKRSVEDLRNKIAWSM